MRKTNFSIVSHFSSLSSLSSPSRSRSVLLVVNACIITYRSTQPLCRTFFLPPFDSTNQQTYECPPCPVSHCTANSISSANNVDHGPVLMVSLTHSSSSPARALIFYRPAYSRPPCAEVYPLYLTSSIAPAVARASFCPSSLLEHARTRTHSASCRSWFARTRILSALHFWIRQPHSDQGIVPNAVHISVPLLSSTWYSSFECSTWSRPSTRCWNRRIAGVQTGRTSGRCVTLSQMWLMESHQ